MSLTHRLRHWRTAMMWFALLAPGAAFAAPGDVLFSDNFERANIAPWTTNNGFRSGILTGADVSNSGTRGLFTRHDPVITTGPTFSAAVPAAEVSLWARRGSDAFSEYPDGGEDLVIEYRRADGTWGSLITYPGGGPEGQIFQDTIFLPPDALHANTALRVRQTGGSGNDFDYWHVDDIRVVERVAPPALVVGTCDEFDTGLSTNWTVTSAGGNAGTSSATFQSPSASLFTNGGQVTVTSNAIDTTDPAFDAVSLWVRRGADAFSENPDGIEDFTIEYLDSGNTWVLLETFGGSGTPGEIFNRNYAMPVGARHAAFRIRFRQEGGSGLAFDFWHVDDVCLDVRDLPQLQVTKVSSTISDPVNGTTNPYAIPGAIKAYDLSVSNTGAGAVDADTLVLTDVIPDDLALFVDTGSGDPVVFSDGGVASGVSLSFATGVRFSSQPGGGAPFDYVPTPDADGFDAAVTGVRIALTGAMNGDSGGGAPSFVIRLLARVD